MWLLVWLMQSQAPSEPPALPVRLAIPDGYIETVLKDRGERVFIRRFAAPPEGEIRLSTVLLPGPVAEGMTPPYTFLRPAQLAPDTQETMSTLAWQGLDIYAAEHAYEAPEGRRFVATASLPLKEQALIVRLSGPEGRAPEAREDLRRLLADTRAVAGWLTPLEKTHRRQSTWALYGAGLLLAAYAVCWAAFFRGRPTAFHGLRTGWLFAGGGALLVPAMLGVNLVWALPAMFVLSLAVRRIKLALEL